MRSLYGNRSFIENTCGFEKKRGELLRIRAEKGRTPAGESFIESRKKVRGKEKTPAVEMERVD